MHAYDYRSQARWALKGKWKVMIAIMLMAQIVLSGFGLADIVQNYFSNQQVIDGAIVGMDGYQLAYSLPTNTGWLLMAIGQLIALLGNVVYIGLYRVCSSVLGGGWPDWRQLFPVKLFFKALWMNIVRGLLVALQFLLLIVPGFIAIYRYSMADYLLAENPDLGPIEALRLSGRHMKGHKGRLFGLHISFFGWALLASMVPVGVLMLLAGLPGQVLVIIELLLTWLCTCALDVYTYTAETAFFIDLLHGSTKRDWREASRQTWQQAQGGGAEEESGKAEHVHSRADEARAHTLFVAYKCSIEAMRAAGRMDEYLEYNPSRMGEEMWKRDYANLLMRRFDGDPDALDDLLSLAAEYALDDLADRMLMRISRHARQKTLPAGQVLNMVGRMLAMLTSGAFAANEGFVGRKKAQIKEMADGLEERLAAENPDGDWQQAMKLVREMCA